ncbi:calcium-binding protein [Bradyrhizobium sp. AUGA SZCCT0158]|uniref:beta strand repeat-containing protein n=1 Tax=Bradyrhizobium sp. AUGA SZCCT0158 TaxID=2807661 RepID=UPI001BA92A39|nr:calcium-binding protein [Bradyrhizobium sp. AUGA SZCCT0158]
MSFDDIDTNDVVDISSSYNNDIVWSGGSLTAGQIAALTAGTFTASATDAAALGTTPWSYTANDVALDFLDDGESITFSYTVTATDDSGASAIDTVTITINGTNDAPVAVNDKLVVSTNTIAVFSASALLGNDGDIDGDGLRIISVSGPGVDAGNLTLDVDAQTITYNSTLGVGVGADAFTYVVSDGSTTSSGTMSIDVVNANSGFNLTTSYSGAGSYQASYLDFGGGADAGTGAGGSDFLVGGSGDDTLLGGSGNDTIMGGADADSITGGTGVDLVIVNAAVGSSSDSARDTIAGNGNDAGEDAITGFDLSNETLKVVATNVSNFVHGTDTAIGTAGAVNDGTVGSFTALTGLIELNQATNNDWDNAGDIAVTFASPIGTFNEANFEARLQYNLTGTSGSDTITTGALDDTVNGGAGNDTIVTGSSNDTITGGTGADSITGGTGVDLVIVNAAVGSSSDSGRNTIAGNGNDAGEDTITGFDLSNETLKIVATNVSSFVHGTDTAIGTAGAVNDGTVGSFTALTGLIELNQATNNDWDNAGDIAVTFASPIGTFNEANFEARLQYNLTGTSGNDTITTGALDDTVNGGAGNDTIVAGSGDDTITGGTGADSMTGGSGADMLIVGSAQSPGTISGSTVIGYDVITDFDIAFDTLDLAGTPVTAGNTGGLVNGSNSTLTIGGSQVSQHSITNGIITFYNDGGSLLNLTSNADVAAAVQYLHIAANDLGNTGTTVAFTATFSGPVAHTFIFEQVGTAPSAANDILVDLVGVTVANLSTLIPSHIFPAGIAGESINLALTNPSADPSNLITVTIAGVPLGWSLNAGTNNGDGTWIVHTNDPSALTVTAPVDFIGATVLHVSQTWTNADGTTGIAKFFDNVEAYAPGSPIFAVSGDDNLTGSSGNDLFVVAQPIGQNTIYNFDTAHDQIDLIGYAGFTTFVDVQAQTINNDLGDAVITLGDGQSIILQGVDANSLSADDFVFDQTPVVQNAGNMVIGDGAIMPLSGIIENTGTIELNSTGAETDLQLIQHGISLEGHGQVILSDSTENVITGTVSDVTLTNVDNTISGAGQLGAGQMILINEGTIIATGSNSLEIDTGANTIVNSGTLEATGSGGLVIDSNLDNSGLLWANGADITLNGSVTGDGTALIDGVATIEFEAASSVNVTFAAEATGTLKLGDSFDFSGIVSGFNEDDHFDLLDVSFGEGTSVSYVENSEETGGTLTVSDGVHTANISLLGDYSADGFIFAADATTGTLLSYRDDLI